MEINIQPKPSHRNFRDIEGQRFGRLLVIGFAGLNKSRLTTWYCQCDCGEIRINLGSLLRGKKVQGCGCLRRELFQTWLAKNSHGYSHTRIYNIWGNMLQRCTNPNNNRYKDYGGRGITVCDRWRDFRHFLADMGEPTTNKHEIDRKNNDGNYEPSNCHWVTKRQSMLNRRCLVTVVYQGAEKPLLTWCEELGLPYKRVLARIQQLKWDVEAAFFTPKKLHKW